MFWACVLLGIVLMWVRSESFRYDMAWIWLRPDAGLVVSSQKGYLWGYIELLPLDDGSGAGWIAGDDRAEYWSVETTAEVVLDEPAYDHSLLGVSWGEESFLADTVIVRSGVSIQYVTLAVLAGCFSVLGLVMLSRRPKPARLRLVRLAS